jgi:transcriptional regulator with XRE-family HTH domain
MLRSASQLSILDCGSTSVESPTQLHETLRRISALIEHQGLNRSALLNPQELASRTALPMTTVRALLKGSPALPDTVNDRVRARLKALSNAHLARTGRRMSDLAADIGECLGVSDYWARQVCDGKKVPSVEFLHGLVEYFKVEGGEAFFTAPADEALNRVLLPVLTRLENPKTDPVQALMDRYGVKATDLRIHGSLTRDQLERLLEGVFRSVLPPEGEDRS